MNTFFSFKISLITICFLGISNLASAQGRNLPPGNIQFKDSILTDVSLDFKNADKGVLRYRKSGEDNFQRASLAHVVGVEVYPNADGAMRQTFIVRSREVDHHHQLVLVELLQAGEYALFSELNTEDSFYLEDPDGEVIKIPTSAGQRKSLIDKLLKDRNLNHHNKTVYAYKAKPLRNFTAYMNGPEQQKFPGFYFKGKMEYLAKVWNFTSLGVKFNLPIVLFTTERVNLEAIQGQTSNIFAFTALFETPFYRNKNLTVIQEIGLRKELTSVFVENELEIVDLKLDASFLTGELAVKYSYTTGKHYPFVRLGLGSSFLIKESNVMSRSQKDVGGIRTKTTNDNIVSAFTLHPGLRAGTAFYLKGPYLLTTGLTYTREMMLYRPVASSSNAFGVYVAANFY